MPPEEITLDLHAEQLRFTLAVESQSVILGIWIPESGRRIYIHFHTPKSILGFLNMFRKVE